MTDQNTIANRVTLFRGAVWIVVLLVAWLFFHQAYPLAWQAAAFGAIFSWLWPPFRRSQAGAKRGAAPAGAADAAAPEEGPSADRFGLAIDAGVDLVVITALVNVTGGFNSVFSPLYFVAVIEAFALLGPASAVYAALAAALLSLAHLRVPSPPRDSLILYGIAIGSLIVSAAMVGLRQSAGQAASAEAVPGVRIPWPRRNATLLKQRTIESLEQQIEEQEVAFRQLKATYREVAFLNRDQKVLIERLRSSEHLYSISAALGQSVDSAAAFTQLLRCLMDSLEAGAGILWIRDRHDDSLTVVAAIGRIAASAKTERIRAVADLTASEIRVLCEDTLLPPAAAVPSAAPLTYTKASEVFDPTRTEPVETVAPEEDAPPVETNEEARQNPTTVKPVLVMLLREPTAEANDLGRVIGAVGVCEPRGAARFNQTDVERFNILAFPAAETIGNIERQRGLQKRIHEISLLYNLSQLVQSATDMNQIYKAVVEHVKEIVDYENCTLFLLDKSRSRLEAKATRGRVVNLLDHISFEKGKGVSGWVVARGKQINIPDLTVEHNLLDVELIPPRVRSFVAVPLIVQKNVVGVLNVSHSRPNAFAPEDVQLLTILAGQAAITIERTEVFHTLENLAITDGLTQVYNHRFFHLRLEDELRRGKRYNVRNSIMFVDADEFKKVNDTYGHATGDLVLRDLAAVLKGTVRETEIVARYGGEEFGVILPETGNEQALVAAERLRANVAEHTFLTTEGEPVNITISIGLATFPGDGKSRADLIDMADKALYSAKNAGRNCVRTAGGTS